MAVYGDLVRVAPAYGSLSRVQFALDMNSQGFAGCLAMSSI